MHFLGIGTATPPARYTKAECLVAFEASDWFGRLDDRAHLIARTVLQRDNGIDARRLAVDSLDEVFTIEPNTLARRFVAHAPELAARAATRALAQAGLAPGQVDAVVVSTCTGYVCPGLSGHVVERLGLRSDLQAFDLVGQGCAAALPGGSAAIVQPHDAQRLHQACPDLDDWPRSWHVEPADIPVGQQIVALFTPFLLHLLDQGLAKATVRRHRDNLWTLGGELIRQRYDDDELARHNAADAIAQLIEGDGGPLIWPRITEAEQDSLATTCRKLDRFMRTSAATSRPG